LSRVSRTQILLCCRRQRKIEQTRIRKGKIVVSSHSQKCFVPLIAIQRSKSYTTYSVIYQKETQEKMKQRTTSVRFASEAPICFSYEAAGGDRRSSWITPREQQAACNALRMEILKLKGNTDLMLKMGSLMEQRSPQKRRDDLVEVYAAAETLRGIEQYVSAHHLQVRTLVRKAGLQAVLAHQAKLSRLGIAPSDKTRLQLARVVEETTHRARLYAQAVAAADRILVTQQYQEDELKQQQNDATKSATDKPNKSKTNKLSKLVLGSRKSSTGFKSQVASLLLPNRLRPSKISDGTTTKSKGRLAGQ
jgi:hypothetical protein